MRSEHGLAQHSFPACGSAAQLSLLALLVQQHSPLFAYTQTPQVLPAPPLPSSLPAPPATLHSCILLVERRSRPTLHCFVAPLCTALLCRFMREMGQAA